MSCSLYFKYVGWREVPNSKDIQERKKWWIWGWAELRDWRVSKVHLKVASLSLSTDWPNRKAWHLGTLEGKGACDLHSLPAFPNLVSTAIWLQVISQFPKVPKEISCWVGPSSKRTGDRFTGWSSLLGSDKEPKRRPPSTPTHIASDEIKLHHWIYTICNNKMGTEVELFHSVCDYPPHTHTHFPFLAHLCKCQKERQCFQLHIKATMTYNQTTQMT